MKTAFQYEVISRLKKLREERNYTQASIAKLLEISPGQLGNIESIKQEHKFTLAQILKICDELNISAHIERSRSGGGAHVWIFFDTPVASSSYNIEMQRKLNNLLK